jgi:hypothetical protein
LFAVALSALLMAPAGAEAIEGGQNATSSYGTVALWEGGNVLTCSGVLISQKAVLTARHCVNGLLSPSQIAVSTTLEPEFGHHLSPKYIRLNGKADLAILLFESPITANATVAFARHDPAVGDECWTYGFGFTRKGRDLANVLKRGRVARDVAQSADDKKDTYGGRGVFTTERVERPGASGGQVRGGDSGGPVICNGVLAGINVQELSDDRGKHQSTAQWGSWIFDNSGA